MRKYLIKRVVICTYIQKKLPVDAAYVKYKCVNAKEPLDCLVYDICVLTFSTPSACIYRHFVGYFLENLWRVFCPQKSFPCRKTYIFYIDTTPPPPPLTYVIFKFVLNPSNIFKKIAHKMPVNCQNGIKHLYRHWQCRKQGKVSTTPRHKCSRGNSKAFLHWHNFILNVKKLSGFWQVNQTIWTQNVFFLAYPAKLIFLNTFFFITY